MFQDLMKLSGELDILLLDKDGNVKDSRKETNLVVSSGLSFITSRMAGTSPAVMSHMGLGTSTAADNASFTNVQTPSGLRKALGTTTDPDGVNVVSNTITYTAIFGDGEGLSDETVAGNGTATTAVTEAGIFNASSGGTMLCRTVFPVVNKAAGDTLQITWTITLTAS